MDDPVIDMQDMLKDYSPEDVMAAAAWILGSVGCRHSNMSREQFLKIILMPVAMAWDMQNESLH
jgi:hypothetical protein